MSNKVFAIALVTALFFIVPIIVYGIFSRFGLAQIPGGSPASFLTGVLISKIGTAFAFVLFFTLAPSELGKSWLVYAAIWWVMFAFGEVGKAIGPDYPWSEAIAGMISEAAYFPAAAFVLHWMMR